MGRIHYGWIILAITVFQGFILSGIGFAFGVFVLPMSRDLGWSQQTVVYGFGVRQITSGLFQPLSGALVRRFGPKKLILWGLLVLGVSTALIFTVNSPWQFYLLFGVASTIGTSMGAVGPIVAMLSRWFRKRRAMTLAIRQTSGSVGQLALTGVIFLLLQTYGWRLTWVILGLLILLVVVPMSSLFLKDDPSEKGLLPDAERPAPGSAPPPVVKGAWQKAKAPASGELNLGLRDALRSRNFWMLSIGYFGCGVSWTFIAAYFVPYSVTEVGVSEATAAMAYAVMGGANVVGIMSAGYLADKVGRKVPLGVVYIGRGVSALMILNAVNEWQVFAAATVMGLCSFASVPLVQSTVAENWGTISMALIQGVIGMSHQVAGFLATLFGAWIMRTYGSADQGWMIMAATLFVGGIMSFVIREKRARQAVAAPAR